MYLRLAIPMRTGNDDVRKELKSTIRLGHQESSQVWFADRLLQRHQTTQQHLDFVHLLHLRLRSLDVDVRASAALVALSRHDLVVVRSEVEAVARPGVEMVLHVDRAADTLVLANRPVLLESPGAIDGRLVDTGGDVDVVGAAVGGEAALELSARAGVVGACRCVSFRQRSIRICRCQPNMNLP